MAVLAPLPRLQTSPCPHCGAPLSLASPQDGERGRCGTCRQPTLWFRGALHIAEPIGLPNEGDEAVLFACHLYH